MLFPEKNLSGLEKEKNDLLRQRLAQLRKEVGNQTSNHPV